MKIAGFEINFKQLAGVIVSLVLVAVLVLAVDTATHVYLASVPYAPLILLPVFVFAVAKIGFKMTKKDVPGLCAWFIAIELVLLALGVLMAKQTSYQLPADYVGGALASLAFGTIVLVAVLYILFELSKRKK